MPSLLIVNHYAGLPTGSSGLRHWNLATVLDQLNWECKIITADREHPSGKKRTISENRNQSEFQGPKLILIRTTKYSGNGILRVVNMLWFSVLTSLLPKRSLGKVDFVLGSTVHPFAALSAWILSKRLKAKFVFEIRDLWPETFIQFDLFNQKSLFCKSLFALEKFLWQRAVALISPLAGIPKYGIDRKYPVRTFYHLANCSNTSEIPYKVLARNTQPRLAYMGSMGVANNLQILIEATHKHSLLFPKSRFMLDIYGDGPLKSQLKSTIEIFRLDNVTLMGSVSRATIIERMSEYDGFVLPFYDAPSLYNFGASPNKLADYLAAGRPVLIGMDFPGNPIVHGENGFIIKSTVDDWVKTLQEFINLDYVSLEMMCRSARDTAIKELDIENNAQRLSNFLLDLMKN